MKILFAVSVIAVVISWFFNQSEEIPLSELALENAEALARGENQENYVCIGDGEIDCYGMKVKYRSDGFR